MISISRASICLSRKFILSMSCFNWKEKASCAILIPKVSAAASLMEMALALVSRLWLLSFMISKSSSIGAFSIFSGVRYFSRMPMDVLTQREENCFSYSGKICSIIVPIRSLISVLEEMTESR